VSDEFLVTCPYCGEQVEIYVEPDVNGTFVQDCEVAAIHGASRCLVEMKIGLSM
jgi:hypothetical protein